VIPYGKQSINKDDISSVIKVLSSDFLTQGPQVPLFEEKVSNYSKSNYAVAVNSATSALHISCLALGLGEGDWLWTSPNSFVASSNCGLLCKSSIDFVDIDPKTFNMCPEKLEQKLVQAKINNNLPKIVIPVHFAGQSCEMKKIHKLSKTYGFKIIEDASHAIGGSYLDTMVGSCSYSDITVFSFHPVKIITTTEGGIATTNSKILANKMMMYRSHGVTRDQELMNKKSEGGWYYQQVELGLNYRMTEVQAVLGLSQLKRIDKFISKRHTLKDRYDFSLNSLPLIKPFQSPNCFSSLHLYPVQIKLNQVKFSRKFFYNQLIEKGIGVNVHYIPIHLQPYYQKFGFKVGDFPNAEAYYNRAITIPMYPEMTFKNQDKVIKAIKNILN
jgi:UDP-4-amino-4,6-dideoxy-N-acetyl-beta-L-altrosamine transaminase